MRGRLETFIDQLQQTQSRDDLQSQIAGLRDIFDVEHLVYHSLDGAGNQYAALTYDQAWVDHYIDRGYARIDPVVQGCFQRFHPVDWKRLDWSSKAARAFFHEALDAGVGNQGLSIPIRGPNGQFALFTVNQRASDGDWLTQSDTHTSDLILVAHFVNQKALEIDGHEEATPMKALSPRETDVLTLLALGNSRAQAADTLSISEHTLRVYVEAARLKLGAQNTTHAVALALRLGLLVL